MLSRSSNDANNRLRRAKSASSVQKRRQVTIDRELVNPEIVHQHALTAASRAMQLAGERASMDSRGSYDLPRFDDRVSGRRATVDQPPRSQSIRFMDNEGSISQRSIRYSSPLPPSAINVTTNGESSPETVTMPLPQISEAGTIEDGISSTPSSYRKLRRAKSMFSTRQGDDDRHRQISDASDGGFRSMGVLRRSISFMKGGNGQSLRRSKSQTAAVQLARDQFLHGLAQQSQRDEPGPVRQPRREHKPFRTTVRNLDINNSDNTTFSSQSATQRSSREGSFGSKARILSYSIKKGLKRVFRRSSTTQSEIQDPRQSGRHSYCDTRPQSSLGLDIQGFPTHEYIQQHEGYYGSSDEYPGTADSIIDRPPSIHTISSDSLNTANSRATSWTDSNRATPIPGRQSLDRNRLSIIQEHDLQRVPAHSKNGYSVFSKPLRALDGSDGSVDSQRVYSALRRRIDGNRPRQSADDNNQPKSGVYNISPPERTSSIYSNRTSHTIRPVPSELSIRSVKSTIRTRPPSAQSQFPARSGYPSDNIGLTPQQIAKHNEKIARRRSKQSMREVNSSFFSPISNKKKRTPSPCKAERGLNHEHRFNPDEDSGSVIVSRPACSESRSVSPSVYSRTPDSNTPKQRNDGIYIPIIESREEERGTATILASHRLPYNASHRQPSYHLGERPVKASADWKTWMDSQMTGFDGQSSRNTQYGSPEQPNNKHFRENAQIGEEDGEIGNENIMQQSVRYDEGSVFDEPGSKKSRPHQGENRGPLMELKTIPQNNFSRLLHRPPNPPMPDLPDLPPLFRNGSNTSQPQTKPAATSSENLHTKKSKESLRSNAVALSQHSSPWIPHKSSYSAMLENSPTPKGDRAKLRQTVSLRGHYGGTPTKYGDDTTSPSPTRFSSARTRERSGRVTNENIRTGGADFGYLRDDTSGLVKPGDPLYSTTSSKRMVDLFLSSRRRQMGASEESTSEPAFL